MSETPRPIAELIAPVAQTCVECGTPAPADAPKAGRWWCPSHEETERARAQREQDREQQRIRDHYLGVFGVPANYRGCTFASLKSNAIVEAGQAWLHARGFSRGRFLAMAGPTGVGKTAVACAIHNALLGAGERSQRFMLAGELYRRLRSFDSVSEAMEEGTTTRLLVLDDFQAPRLEIAPLLEELFIAREAEGRATVLTTNLTRKALLEVLSDRVVDRVRSGEVREFPGRSLRGVSP
jgi:DNA replication protein DnaC